MAKNLLHSNAYKDGFSCSHTYENMLVCHAIRVKTFEHFNAKWQAHCESVYAMEVAMSSNHIEYIYTHKHTLANAKIK